MPELAVGPLFYSDGSATVEISAVALASIQAAAATAYPKEAGGVLIGNYSSDLSCVRVLEAPAPASDTRSGLTWLFRGWKGVKALLKDRWLRNKSHYIGEWHSHPGAAPIASRLDRRQIEGVAASSNYECAAPLLIIIGGKPPTEWELSVELFSACDGWRTLRMTEARRA